jgi:hypothetical protein
VHYQIRVNGVLGSGWSAWFDGLRVTSDEHGQTTIAGPIADQAAPCTACSQDPRSGPGAARGAPH